MCWRESLSSTVKIVAESFTKCVFFILTKYLDSKWSLSWKRTFFEFACSGSNVMVVTKLLARRGKRTSTQPRSFRPRDLVPTSRRESTTSWERRRLTLVMFTSELSSLETNRLRSSLVWSRGMWSRLSKWAVFDGQYFRYVDTGDMMNDFPYRARAMFAFEEQDGVDVCFFGMHVQVRKYWDTNLLETRSQTISIFRSTVVSVLSPTPEGSMLPILTQSTSSNQGTLEQLSTMKFC